ncbi:MAG: KamA family radical SAM protein [Methanomassiliicoccales archaeon]
MTSHDPEENGGAKTEALKGWSDLVESDTAELTDLLWREDGDLYSALKREDLEEARSEVRSIVWERYAYLDSGDCDLPELERINARNCCHTLSNFLSTKNEELTGESTLGHLHRLARGDERVQNEVTRAFLTEIIQLVRGSQGRSDIYREKASDFLSHKGREAASMRSAYLDEFAERCHQRIRSYPSGLHPQVIERREGNRKRILDYFGGGPEDWDDYHWHMRNVITTLQPLEDLLEMAPEEREAVRLAEENHIPFGVTPYYLHLMDREPHRKWDHAVRAQVIPPLSYVKAMMAHRDDREYAFDFMKEHETSPVDLVTRRYPMIAILKPYNTCAQICVYCQRNWEIDEVLSPQAMASREELDRAVEWFQEHPAITEILVTGGDPALVGDQVMDRILGRLAELEHVERLRIGTRAPVVIPMRITEELADIFASYHELPEREVCLVSHYEHPYEVTPESKEAIQKIRRRGMSAYNQQVFTFENSRRFETAALRIAMKRIGVDPYYTFNTKGKEETGHYRAPLARLMQERKEEARVLPGIVRTDEPVFNIPAIGKNHVRAGQHHEYIMLSPQGERFYQFHPWEKNIVLEEPYVYRDVPILEYLERLEEVGEDVDEYRNIWYYF